MSYEPYSLSDEIIARVRDADGRLRRIPYYARLLRGDVTSDEYAAWLVQLHKYVRHTERGERALADSMTARADHDPAARGIMELAREEAAEEEGHDLLLLDDLAALWGVSRDAARERVEREPSAPSVDAWGGLIDLMLARYPQGVVGVALALETLATLQVQEIFDGLLRARQILAIEQAVSFVAAHTPAVEERHQAAGIERAGLLQGAVERSAAYFYADAAISLYVGIARFLDERFSAAPTRRLLEVVS